MTSVTKQHVTSQSLLAFRYKTMTFWYDLYTFENFILCEEIFYMKLRLLCGFYVSFIVFINVHFFFGNQPPVLQFITHPKNFPLCLTFQPSKHWNVVATYSKMTRRRTDVNRINKSLPYRATLPNVFFFIRDFEVVFIFTYIYSKHMTSDKIICN